MAMTIVDWDEKLKKIRKHKATLKEYLSKKTEEAIFKFKTFSFKQLKTLTWWRKDSPDSKKKGIIADGAVRSGKTLIFLTSFLLWAMTTFNGVNFGLCGKTIGSFRRNCVKDLKKIARGRGYRVIDKRGENKLIIKGNGHTNEFYIFGGKDESSQDLIQGITLAGVLFDEVVLMPESFVNQAIARTFSIKNSKYWFTCNPGSPYHWFKLNFIDKAEEKNLLRLHFTMEDNPLMTLEQIEEAKRTSQGPFYKRYVEGLWVAAEGLIYSMFDEKKFVLKRKYIPLALECEKIHITCDYGNNMTTFLLIGKKSGKVYVIDEWCYSGIEKGVSISDAELVEKLKNFLNMHGIKKRIEFILDTNAKSFKTAIEKASLKLKVRSPKKFKAVLDGIREVQTCIHNNMIFVSDKCKNLIKEFSSYCWNQKSAIRGVDEPIKENDHGLDALRYYIYEFFGLRKVGAEVTTLAGYTS